MSGSSTLTEEEKRRRFFYAMHEASLYDTTINWVAPYYELLHQTLVSLVSEHLETRNNARGPYYILDVGCGTGAESIGLLQKFAEVHIVGVDLCAPMLTELQSKLAQQKLDDRRFACVEADFLSEACSVEHLRSYLPKALQRRGFDAVISAFTLHHFTRDQKRFAYRRMYDSLAPRGLLLNGDLFNYESESDQMSEAALKFEVDWIQKKFEKAAETDPHMKELCRRWRAHYLQENHCNSMSTQIAMLREIGFAQWANPFRYWQVGLLYGSK